MLLENEGVLIGGLSPAVLPAETLPPQWLTFFQVSDFEAACGELARLKAALLLPPQGDPAGGRLVIARDPQGAPFGLLGVTR
jgi:hypothetical protein